jgi:hypothetical protein
MSKEVCLAMLSSLLLVAFCVGAEAQIAETGFLGTVSDSRGAVIPGVSVTVRELATNASRSAVANDQGEYVVIGLQPGTYEIQVGAPGFKKVIHTNLVLQISQKARINFTLDPGEVSSTVTVTAQAPLLDTEQSRVGEVISTTQVSELPLNGRNFIQLARLTPGVLVAGDYKVEGNQSFKNNFTFDGIDNVHSLDYLVATTPSIELIDEFVVETGSFSAEHGRFGTSQVHLVSKHGTNHFHGALFEFLRNDKLDARGFFASEKEKLRRNQFGANLNGPIVRDKLFFFFNYEALRTRSEQFLIGTTPTEAMRNGDFSALGISIFDPKTLNPATQQRAQFSGNIIPPGRIDPVARKIMDLMFPHPTKPGFPDNLGLINPITNDNDQLAGRIDWNLSNRHSAFAHFMHDRGEALGERFATTAFQTLNRPSDYHIVVGDTFIFSPSLLNEFRLGFHREPTDLSSTAPDIMSQLGIQGETQPGAPVVNISDIGFFGQFGSKIIVKYNTSQLIDNVRYQRKQHGLTVGIDARETQWNRTGLTFGIPNYTFSGFATNDPNSPGTTGSGFADFLLGLPSQINRRRNFEAQYARQTSLGLYLQDDWKINKKLVLNLGLRYELATRPVEKYGRWTNFDPVLGKVVVALGPDGAIAPGVDPQAAQKYASRFVTADQSRLPDRTLAFGDHNNFAPRFGFAWGATKTTVVRGGYGIYYNLTNGPSEFNRSSNFLWTVTETLVNSDPLTPSLSLANPFPQEGNLPASVGSPMVDPDKRDGYLQQWNFNIQQEIAPKWMVEAGYVGSVSHNLERLYPFNQPDVGPGPIAPRRPYPLFGPFNINSGNGYGNYNALQIKVKNRFSENLTFLASYTFSKNIDDATDSELFANNPYNHAADRGPNALDAPQILSVSYVYRLPFGKGQRWLKRTGLMDSVLGGWTMSGIVTYQSGFPFSPLVSGDIANVGQFSMRPDRIGSGEISHPTPDMWFDPSAFTVPQRFTWGNAGKGILRQDSYSNIDFGVYKNFHISESRRIQFRAEVFNFLNHPSFGTPNQFINLPGAGVVTDTLSTPRQIQLAIKYIF